jgi:hypothetical protein
MQGIAQVLLRAVYPPARNVIGRKMVDTTASICMLVLLWCAAARHAETGSRTRISKSIHTQIL